MSKMSVVMAKAALCAVFALSLVQVGLAQVQPGATRGTGSKGGPKVTQIDIEGLRKLLKPNGKPLLINFWATWCDPCREEFPDLVKLEAEFKGRLDVITVSLDDIEDIGTLVPKFLREVKAEMPAYLLKTPDESAAITMVAKDWSGNLPLTVLYNAAGETGYIRSGKFNTETLRNEINKVVSKPSAALSVGSYVLMDFVKIKDGRRPEAMHYYENNWKLYREAAIKRGVIHSFELVDAKSDTNSAFDLILITRFNGQEQFKNSEKNFEPILKELRPNGPVLLNEVKPENFRQNVFVYNGIAAYSSSK